MLGTLRPHRPLAMRYPCNLLVLVVPCLAAADKYILRFSIISVSIIIDVLAVQVYEYAVREIEYF